MDLKQWGQYDPNKSNNLVKDGKSPKINGNSQLVNENCGEIPMDQLPSNLHAPIINSSKSKYSASQQMFPYLHSIPSGSQNNLFGNNQMKSTFMQSMNKKVSIPGLGHGDFNLEGLEKFANNNSFVLNTSNMYPGEDRPQRISSFKNIDPIQNNYPQRYEYFSELGKRDSIYSESKRLPCMNGNPNQFNSNNMSYGRKDFLDTEQINNMKLLMDSALNKSKLMNDASFTQANSRICLPNWNAQTEAFEKP